MRMILTSLGWRTVLDCTKYGVFYRTVRSRVCNLKMRMQCLNNFKACWLRTTVLYGVYLKRIVRSQDRYRYEHEYECA
jgi:hypothetical protein